MNITLISLHCPTSTNFNGASALPYHLIKFSPNTFHVNDVWTFNLNKVPEKLISDIEKDLNVSIHILNIPKWYKRLFKYNLSPFKLLLKYPLLSYLRLGKEEIRKITDSKPDRIWIYGEDIANFSYIFKNIPSVITTPDSTALFYNRLMAKNSEMKSTFSQLRYLRMFHQYVNLGLTFNKNNVKYHTVGREDMESLCEINPGLDAYFINHPHYETSNNKNLKFQGDKIKILIAGRNDFYMHDATKNAISIFLKNPNFANNYSITFLGKGWEKRNSELLDHGYESNHIRYVEDYIGEISKYDIQLTPIDVGVGTKGKVLDAFSNGLLVIGTKRALENIHVYHNESCLAYSSKNELLVILNSIISNPSYFEKIAKNGRENILAYHGREHVASSFFNLFVL